MHMLTLKSSTHNSLARDNLGFIYNNRNFTSFLLCTRPFQGDNLWYFCTCLWCKLCCKLFLSLSFCCTGQCLSCFRARICHVGYVSIYIHFNNRHGKHIFCINVPTWNVLSFVLKAVSIHVVHFKRFNEDLSKADGHVELESTNTTKGS